jgi:glucose-6-phosphate isomerase
MPAGLDKRLLWDRYRQYRYDAAELGVSLDVSRVRFTDEYLARMSSPISLALDAMERLEGGAIANSDENRMVGHYWLRAPELAPTEEHRAAIPAAITAVNTFATQVREGRVTGTGGPVRHVIHVGIGGSTVGPQLVCAALRTPADPMVVHFLDNSDPDGIDDLIERLDGELSRTLVSVVSKCGWTPTPRYVLQEVEAMYRRRGIDFSRHAVATTVEDSDLDTRAVTERWLARFPMWDWVGGRFSVTSAVGLLPAALQGVDISAFLQGAAAMDRLTRHRNPLRNPAALLALMWYWLGNGHGDKRMVVLPYRDRLVLLSRYVQQLLMESIGKKLDRSGAEVYQGFTVYGNKGSTDQHSYIQQLREGTPDFFATLIYVHDNRRGPAIELKPDVTLEDHLFGSVEGTRNGLYERGRDSITLTLPDLSPTSMGALIALFERALGLYAELINMNAYHQPGVDKNVAAETTNLQALVVAQLRGSDTPQTAEEIASCIGHQDQVETVYKLLERLARDRKREIAMSGGPAFAESFWMREAESIGARATDDSMSGRRAQ